MKYEWKKAQKACYNIKAVPTLTEVPAQPFIMIDGEGNPNAPDFSERVSALYALAYAVKMDYKKAFAGCEIDDFTVYPLEGIWRRKTQGTLVKEDLIYTIMIGQPDFITAEMVASALEKVRVKKPNPLYDEIRFERMDEGKCVSILHQGAFDDEPASFAKLDGFCNEKGLKRNSDYHREIYLNNLNRTAVEKLKTILRYTVE